MTLRSQVVEFVCRLHDNQLCMICVYIIHNLVELYMVISYHPSPLEVCCVWELHAYLRLRTEDLAQSGLVVCWSSEIHVVEPPQRKKNTCGHGIVECWHHSAGFTQEILLTRAAAAQCVGQGTIHRQHHQQDKSPKQESQEDIWSFQQAKMVRNPWHWWSMLSDNKPIECWFSVGKWKIHSIMGKLLVPLGGTLAV